jgi:short-subunit dehydrogenase
MARRRIDGIRALVTGASSGIGCALARELAQHGARLLLVARNRQRLDGLAQELSSQGHEAEVVCGDLTHDAVRQQAANDAGHRWGGLDLLVNCAGVGASGPFAEASPDRLRQIMEVNFFALAELTRLALPLLRRGMRPMVVNVGSILGHLGLPTMAEYSASKFAVRGLSQALRAELAPVGIDVLLVSPATTATEFFDHQLEVRGSSAWRFGKGIAPEKVARATVRAIRRGSREIFPGWGARLLRAAVRFAPGAVDWFLRRRQ